MTYAYQTSKIGSGCNSELQKHVIKILMSCFVIVKTIQVLRQNIVLPITLITICMPSCLLVKKKEKYDF